MLSISEHLHDLLSKDFANQMVYGMFPAAFARIAARADDVTPELGVAIHRLLIATLCVSDPADGADPPDTFLVKMLSELMQSSKAPLQRRLIRALDAQWAQVETSMELADEDNAQAIEMLEARVAAANEVWPRPLLEIALNAMKDFARVSASMRAAFRSKPSSFLDLEAYVGGLDERNGPYGWPLMFRYTVDDLLSTTYPTPESADPDGWWERKYFRFADGTELWSHRLQPQPNLPTRLDRTIWNAVMRNISGPMALLEHVDWLHPLYGPWLRASGRERRVKYVRRVSMS